MTIAQRFVASEADFRLDDSTSILPSDNDQSQPDHVTDVTNLKWITLRAEHRAYHIANLPNRARSVLAALARTVDNARPADKIFAGRDILQDRAMVPERTFFRALTDLAQAGLIVRHKQWDVPGRAGWNRAYLVLTEAAIALLGFNERTQQRRAQVSKDLAANDDDVQNSLSASANVAGPINRDLYPASQKRQPGQLPEDLQCLQNLGFHDFLIFKLMREARDQGKRLSDIVNVSWQHIKAAAKPICYVRALLRSATDFAALGRYKQQTHQADKARTDAKTQLASAISDASGKVFYDAAATRRIQIASNGQTAQLQNTTEPGVRVAAGAWQAGFVDALASGQWVTANPVLEATFLAAIAFDRPPQPRMPKASSRDAIAALRSLFKIPKVVSIEPVAA